MLQSMSLEVGLDRRTTACQEMVVKQLIALMSSKTDKRSKTESLAAIESKLHVQCIRYQYSVPGRTVPHLFHRRQPWRAQDPAPLQRPPPRKIPAVCVPDPARQASSAWRMSPWKKQSRFQPSFHPNPFRYSVLPSPNLSLSSSSPALTLPTSLLTVPPAHFPLPLSP